MVAAGGADVTSCEVVAAGALVVLQTIYINDSAFIA